MLLKILSSLLWLLLLPGMTLSFLSFLNLFRYYIFGIIACEILVRSEKERCRTISCAIASDDASIAVST